MQLWCLFFAGSLLLGQEPSPSTSGAGPGRPPGARGGGGGGPQRSSPRPQREVAYKPEELCRVSGSVRHAQTGEPLRKANILLVRIGGNPRGNMPAVAATGADGKFALGEVEPGQYRLSAERTGFVRSEYGARGGSSGGGTTLTLDKGQVLSEVEMKLQPQAVVTGKVSDEDGDPMMRVNVQLLRYRYIQGKRQLVPVGFANTDDRGEYRIFGIAPGRYYLSAAASRGPEWGIERQGNESESYLTTYFPGTPDFGSATTVNVPLGGEVQGMDVRLLKGRTVRVRGTVGGGPGGRGSLMMVPREAVEMGMMVMNRRGGWQRDGSFELRGVRPGSYLLRADTFDEASNTRLSAILPVDVGNRDLEGVTVQLTAGREMTGILKMAGNETPSWDNVNLYLDPKLGGAMRMFGGGNARVKADGSFRFEHLSPMAYTVRAFGMAEDVYLQAVRWNSVDGLEDGIDLSGGNVQGLEVVLAHGAARIEGAVTNAKDEPLPGAVVVLRPKSQQRRTDLFKTVTSDQNGQYRITGIAPGEYQLLALEQLDPAAAQDPDLWEQHGNAAVSISLKEKAAETRTLKAFVPADAFLQ